MLMAVGCSGGVAPGEQQAPPEMAITEDVQIEESSTGEAEVPMPGGDMQNRGMLQGGFFENMVFGRVKNIVGNEIEVELGEMSEEQQEEMSRRRGQGEGNGNAPQDGITQDGQRAQGGAPQGDGQQRQRPQGGAPQGDGQQRQRPQGDAPQGGPANGTRPNGGGMVAMPEIELTYTGESAYYIVPVGMAVGGGDYTALTAGTVIGISLDDAGEVTAILIFGGR